MTSEWPDLQQWIGKTEVREDSIALAPLTGLAATLDHAQSPRLGDPVPPLGHWLYFLPTARQSLLDRDGHPRRGDLLPPVPLPRRMWAGSTVEFRGPIRIGQSVTRRSRIEGVSCKRGRSGTLVFVKVANEIATPEGLAIVETQDLVYREAASATDAAPPLKPAPRDEAWSRTIEPSPALLFRYSALTFNAHRIHYDLPYAREVEHYPGLVVHGPLSATLLMELLRENQPKGELRTFTFRAVCPLCDVAPFSVCGRPDGPARFLLWTRDAEGAVTMEASATLDLT